MSVPLWAWSGRSNAGPLHAKAKPPALRPKRLPPSSAGYARCQCPVLESACVTVVGAKLGPSCGRTAVKLVVVIGTVLPCQPEPALIPNRLWLGAPSGARISRRPQPVRAQPDQNEARGNAGELLARTASDQCCRMKSRWASTDGDPIRTAWPLWARPLSARPARAARPGDAGCRRRRRRRRARKLARELARNQIDSPVPLAAICWATCCPACRDTYPVPANPAVPSAASPHACSSSPSA